MFPNPSFAYSANSALTHTKPCSKVYASFSAVEDVTRIIFRQFCSVVGVSSCLAQHLAAMKRVLAFCDPFKVVYAVVPLVPVFVIDLRESVRVGNKRLSHKPMQVAIDGSPPVLSAIEADKPVAIACQRWLQLARFVFNRCFTPTTVDCAWNACADHLARVRDGVATLVARDFEFHFFTTA